MKPILVLVLCLTILLGSTAIAGCGGNADQEAREVLDQANGHLETASVEFEKMDELNTKSISLMEGEPNEKTIPEVESILQAFKSSMEKALKEIKEAKALFEKVLNMNVSEEMKKYLKMKSEALWEQKQVLEIQLKALDLRIELFNAQMTGVSMEQIYELAKQLSELDDQANDHIDKAEAKNKDANEYYEEKNLDK
ncbi:MAG: hypothetical protein JW738_02005 [Actinobacteria bacterium]|nr:hypothetical protein [Actinomycetota bacterium]